VHEHELRHAPGGFEVVDRLAEIERGGGFANGIDQRVVGRILRPRAEQQSVGFQGAEILAIDPDQIDGAVSVAPGCLLGEYPSDDGRGVVNLDVFHSDAVARFGLLGGPTDIPVDRV